MTKYVFIHMSAIGVKTEDIMPIPGVLPRLSDDIHALTNAIVGALSMSGVTGSHLRAFCDQYPVVYKPSQFRFGLDPKYKHNLRELSEIWNLALLGQFLSAQAKWDPSRCLGDETARKLAAAADALADRPGLACDHVILSGDGRLHSVMTQEIQDSIKSCPHEWALLTVHVPDDALTQTDAAAQFI